MKKKLTMEEHMSLARSLRNIQNEVSGIRAAIEGRGLISSVGQRISALEKRLGDVKCSLDTIMFHDHPKDPLALPDVYYGRSENGDPE